MLSMPLVTQMTKHMSMEQDSLLTKLNGSVTTHIKICMAIKLQLKLKD